LKKRFLVVALVLCVSGSAISADMDSFKFALLDIDMGARAAAMSGAFTALTADYTSVYYNPAGLSKLKMIEISGAYDKWMMDSSFQYGSAIIPVGFGSIGAMFSYTSYGTFDARNTDGFVTGEIEPYSLTGGISYGFPAGELFSAGLTAKFSTLAIGDDTEATVLFDLGFLLNFSDMVKIGAVLQNFDIEFSGGFNVNGGLGINIFNDGGYRVSTEVDVKYSGIYGLSYAAGLEIQLFKAVMLRAGYNIGNENSILSGISGLSVGGGVTIEAITVDYAFVSRGDLGMSHLIGLRLNYEGAEERSRKNYQKLTEFLAYQNFKDGEAAFNAGNYRRAKAYWMEVKQMMPEYEGIDVAIERAARLIKTGGSVKKAQTLFEQGMTYYEKFDFKNAVKKWSEVKRMYPDFKDIDVWLDDARELKATKGMSKQAEKYFREGIRHYNNCRYASALAAWNMGLKKDPNNRKIKQYIERAKVKYAEIKEGIKQAKAEVAKDATVIKGIERLREISGVCPAYKDAVDILSTLKDLINLKTRDYYFKGIEKYTQGNLDAAIVYWSNIEKLDPKSEYLIKVRRYIIDARKKQKALIKFDKDKK